MPAAPLALIVRFMCGFALGRIVKVFRAHDFARAFQWGYILARDPFNSISLRHAYRVAFLAGEVPDEKSPETSRARRPS